MRGQYNPEMARQQKERLKEQYPPGTRVELEWLCNDEPGMPEGLRGTVAAIDDWPSLLMTWDNGRSLSLMPYEDRFRKLTPEELLEETQQQSNGMSQSY